MTTAAKATKHQKEDQAPDESDFSAFQIKQQKERTILVGNINSSQKQLKKHFNQFGNIEKLWFRSIATA